MKHLLYFFVSGFVTFFLALILQYVFAPILFGLGPVKDRLLVNLLSVVTVVVSATFISFKTWNTDKAAVVGAWASLLPMLVMRNFAP